ncbi:MAG: multicopper oxidase family protein [Nocardioidaceae bacterium]
MDLTRRDLFKMSVLSGAAVALPLERSVSGLSLLSSRIAECALPAPYSTPFSTPPVIAPVYSDANADYFHVEMAPTSMEIIPGLRTEVWTYNGTLPGPTFRVNQGRQAVVRQVNNLPSTHPVLNYTPWTSVHLHGSASLPQYDGYASDLTNPGEYKDYHFPNWQPARTLWYHDHGVHHTAENVFMGLAGMYQLLDPLEQSLHIPHGEYDVPLIVSDKMFNADGSLLFTNNDSSGFYGDVILVNGRPWPAMKVKRRKYRFRILNASISRSYKWSLSTGDKMAVIGTDAGLVPAPQYVQSFRQGVAERYEVVIDFSKYKPGQRVLLRNTSPKNNINFTNTDKVMAFDVVGDSFSTANNAVPASLNPGQPTMALKEADAVTTRRFDFARVNGQWKINGKTWDDVVASHYTATLASPNIDDVEIWELRNLSGGWHHPVHIHFIDFKILSRNGAPPMPHERGAKDVVFLGENETVRLLIKFGGGRGKYMIHCHNLVHEDHDMMGQFEIVDPSQAAPDPLSSGPYGLPEGPIDESA